MVKRVVDTVMGSLSTYNYGVDSYDPDKLGLGPCLVQQNGSGNENKWAGPAAVSVVRPMEYSTAFAVAFPWAMRWSTTIDWVFFAENSSAAATRRFMAATFNRSTNAFGITGFITVTFPTGTNHTIRAFRMSYDVYSAGTVAVSGTGVTGTSTAWSASRLAVGSRIGFGSTNPADITTWYEISAIGSDTGITLTGSAGTIGSGTPYCIEDLRAIVVTTNATTTNGGVFVVKGLRFENFQPAGTAIAAATSTDNVRASYWLADASTVTNTVAFGTGIEPKTSWTAQNLWVIDTLANPILYKYNIRGALTLSSGKDTTTLAFKTGAGGALSGTPSQLNNGRLATVSHGPGSGSSCFYFTTTTRIYRTVAVSGITTGSTTWIADNGTEVPPGGTATFAASSLLSSLEYASAIDKFIVATNPTTTPFRSYVTQYRTDGGQWDRLFLADTRQQDQGTADSNTTPDPSIIGVGPSVWSEGGMCYIAFVGTTAITNRVYAVPLSADWEYSSLSGSALILPRMACPNIDKFYRAFASDVQIIGGATGKNLGLGTEPYRISYRTSGITDDSGGWTILDSSGDMSSVAGASYVQLKIEFRTMGLTCIPARITNAGVIYTDLTTDDHYQLSAGKSDAANKRFAWWFTTAFGGSVPDLRVRLYDASSGSLLVDDSTTSPTGTFERSTDDGGVWSSWNNTDKGNATTYLRYTPASLSDNIKVRAVLTLA